MTTLAMMPVAKPKTYPYRALGARIAALRDEAGLSQRELADRIGKSWGYFARIETGESRPRPPVLRKIARVLSASYIELAILADYMTEEEVAQLDAPPEFIDIFRDMIKSGVPRSVILEGWELAKALWASGRRRTREDLNLDADLINETEPETENGAE